MALIPPFFLDSVVSIEKEGKDKDGNPEMVPMASGFLFGKNTGKKNQEGKPLYSPFLITNRHVFEDNRTGKPLKEVCLRFNLGGGMGIRYFKIHLFDEKNNKSIWFPHENADVDIAVLPISGTILNQEKIGYFFFPEDEHIFLSSDFKDIGITTGDGVFALGFPLGIRGKERNFVIARQGIIARVDEEVLKERFFYIDTQAYPGNSGGPVILKPELTAIRGTKSVKRAGLIGVVSCGETYRDVAVSVQTGSPRVVFEELSGLVRVVPIELVIETIDMFLKERSGSSNQEKTY